MTRDGLRDCPTKDDIARLLPFEGLQLDRIQVLASPGQIEAALRAIESEGVVGFDTESKPTFTKDSVGCGPHVIQFALRDRAFIVQVGAQSPLEFLKAVIESREITKVGFGLKSDRGQLQRKLGMRLRAAVDLGQELRKLRYRQIIGVKAAVAIFLGRRMHKPKSVTTSNWAVPALHGKQLLYAANDAFAALAVFYALAAGHSSIDEPA